MLKPITVVVSLGLLSGCGAAMTKGSGVPYGVNSTRSSTPVGIAAIDKLAQAEKDCYASQPKQGDLSVADIAKLSAAGQAAYFRAKETASVVKAVRLASGSQEYSPCSAITRSFYQAQIAYEHEVMGAVGTGLKVVGTALGIYAFGNYVLAPLATAAVASGGTRSINIGGKRGTNTSSVPGSAPAGSTTIPYGTASSSGNDSISLADVNINMGDRGIVSGVSGDGSGFAPTGPIGFDNFQNLPGSGIISDQTAQPLYQPNPQQPTNTITPNNSSTTGILN